MNDEQTACEKNEIVQERSRTTKFGFSLDWWAVIGAALIAILLKTGIISKISF